MTSNSEYGSFYSRHSLETGNNETTANDDNISMVSAASGARGGKVISLKPVASDDEMDGYNATHKSAKEEPMDPDDWCPDSPLGPPSSYQKHQRLKEHMASGAVPLGDASSPVAQAPQGVIQLSRKRTEREVLTSNLEKFGFVETKVPADGNCQFRSISWYIYGTDNKHEETRAMVVRHMSAHKELYMDFIEGGAEGYAKYLKKMERKNEWGDHLTMQAAADTFQFLIHIVTSHAYNEGMANGGGSILTVKPRDHEGKHAAPCKEIWVSFCEEHLAEHYNPVSKVRQPSTPRP